MVQISWFFTAQAFNPQLHYVRCPHHGSLNLDVTWNSKVYTSPSMWERLFVPDYSDDDEIHDHNSPVMSET